MRSGGPPSYAIRAIKNGFCFCVILPLLFCVVMISDDFHQPLPPLSSTVQDTFQETYKPTGQFLPYLVFPLQGEEIQIDLRTGMRSVLTEYFQGRLSSTKVIPVRKQRLDEDILYFKRPFNEKSFTSRGENRKWENFGLKLQSVRDFFGYLLATQTDCKKLKRMGGSLQCEKSKGDANNMDGQKYICMDPSLFITSGNNNSDPRNCLILSFGVQKDTTFDLYMADIPCEIHMYDLFDYAPSWAADVDYVHFHRVGLAGIPRVNMYSVLRNFTVPMERLRTHIQKSGLDKRLINILKVDIEDDEWEVFSDVAQDPILDAVGQIALEIHALGLVRGLNESQFKQWPEEQWLQNMQDRYDVLRAIESRGFRRVIYWENLQKNYTYFDEDGTDYATSGELLYINTNWLNSSFMDHLVTRGYEFNMKTLKK